MNLPALARYAAAAARAALRARHRLTLLVSGAEAWGRAAAPALLAGLDTGDVLWVGYAPEGCPATGVAPERALTLLGREWDAVLVDGWLGLDPDTLAAAAGSLRGGGLFLLLAPPLETWARRGDPAARRIAPYPWTVDQLSGRFPARLARCLAAAPGVLHLAPHRPLPAIPAGPPAPPAPGGGPTAEQRRIQHDLAALALERPPRPLVLTADRGRGKSAALGMAAAALLAHEACRIRVTAPRPAAAAVLFRHCAAALGLASGALPELLAASGGRLTFNAPDRLLRETPAADLLLVDEAAALPAPLLQQLLRRYPRTAFATTVHGYEGSGRGFAVRFRGHLERHAPGWRERSLQAPVRWAAGDPLEAWTSQALLLDASGRPSAPRQMGEPCILRLDRDALAGNEPLLREIFGLLVDAHYQTRPLDLRNLLDGPTLEVWVARQGPRVLGACLAAREGALPRWLSRAVWLGRRRVHGHLMPQTLAAHAGHPEAARLRHLRVLRIAVAPGQRRRGIGSRLLRAAIERGRRDGLDLAGASFAAEAGMLAFWQQLGLVPVRLGVRRDAATGLPSVLVATGLSRTGIALAQTLAGRFGHSLPVLRRHGLAGPELAAQLATPPDPGPDRRAERRDLLSFAFGERRLEHCLPALERLLAATPPGNPALRPLVARVLHGRSWAEVATDSGLKGRREALDACRQLVAGLLADPSLRRLADAPGAMDNPPALNYYSMQSRRRARPPDPTRPIRKAPEGD